MKKILIGLVGLIIVFSIALILFVGNLDKIIKGAIEGIGTELLGEPVTVSAVELDLKSGTGQISGFKIANPSGYKAQNAFEMGMIRLAIDIGSLGKQPLVVNELNINSPVVELEARADGSSNLNILLENIEQNSDQADKKAAEQQPQSGESKKGEPARISFKKLAITGVTVNAVIPGQDPANVVIPDIVKENVGGESGVTPAQIGSIIIGDIIGQILKATLEKKLSEKMEDSAKGLFEDIKNKLAPDTTN